MQCAVSYPPPYNILILLKYVVWLPISIQCSPEDIGNVEKSICRVIDRKQAMLYRVHMMHYAPSDHVMQVSPDSCLTKAEQTGQERRGRLYRETCMMTQMLPFKICTISGAYCSTPRGKRKRKQIFLSHFQKVAWLQALFDAHDTLCLDIVTQNCRVTKKGNWRLSVPAETKGKLCRSWNILL